MTPAGSKDGALLLVTDSPMIPDGVKMVVPITGIEEKDKVRNLRNLMRAMLN